jgi:hypothetical protein
VFAADGVNDSIAVFRSDNYVALRANGKAFQMVAKPTGQKKA